MTAEPPPLPVPALVTGVQGSIMTGPALNSMSPDSQDGRYQGGMTLRGRLAFDVPFARSYTFAELDPRAAWFAGSNLAHGETALGFRVGDGLRALVGLGADATRGGTALGPLAGVVWEARHADGTRVSVQGVTYLQTAAQGDLGVGTDFALPGFRAGVTRSWPTGFGGSYAVELGVQSFRQGQTTTWGGGMWTTTLDDVAMVDHRNSLVLGLWGGWAFGGAVR